MKRAAPAALAAALLALAACGCGAAAARGGPGTPASFVVAPGHRFEIRLESSPSTGYRWQLREPLEGRVVELVGSHGEGGIETWTFEAVGPGRATIELVYARPWEEGVAPARFAAYTVEVR